MTRRPTEPHPPFATRVTGRGRFFRSPPPVPGGAAHPPAIPAPGAVPAAGGDHILRRYRSGKKSPRHTVCGGRVEAVTREKSAGFRFGNNTAVKEQGAAVGVPGAKHNVMADHQDGHAPAQKSLHDFGEYLLKFRVQPLGQLVQQQNVRVQQQRLRQCRPLLFAAGEVIRMLCGTDDCSASRPPTPAGTNSAPAVFLGYNMTLLTALDDFLLQSVKFRR